MIIIDTNMLLYAVENKTNVIKQLKHEDSSIAITDATAMELEHIGMGSSEIARNARIAMGIVKKEKLRIVKTGIKNADQAILRAAREHKSEVATSDKELIDKLKERGIKIYILRQGRLVVRA
ncbi:MAG: PIN domain-containing protein [Candidatus Aenigmatarchaeota archaeon]